MDCDSADLVYFCNGRQNGIYDVGVDNTDCDTVGKDGGSGTPCP